MAQALRQFKITALFLMFLFTSTAQSKIDSLENVLKTAKNDTNKVKVITKLAQLYTNTDNTKALLYFNNALKLSTSLSYKKGISTSYHRLGVLYSKTGDYNKSIDCYFKALAISEETRNTESIVILLNNIGTVFYKVHKYDEAKRYLFMGLSISEEKHYNLHTTNILNSIGMVYSSNGLNDSAKYYYLKSIEISRGIQDLEGVANSLTNIGIIYSDQKQYDSALVYFKNTLITYETLGNKKYISAINNNIGSTYYELKDYKKAIEYTNIGLDIAQKENINSVIENGYSTLSDIYFAMGDYKKAFEYKTKFMNIKDSILNEENSKIVYEMSAKFQTEKKQKEIENLTQKNLIQDLDLKKKQITIYSSIIAVILIFILLAVIYNRYRLKQKANTELTNKNRIIEEKQKEILDSIHYAKRIQQSLLPTEKYIEKHLNRLNK